MPTIPQSFSIGKAKKLNMWVPHELTEKLKKNHFEVSSSLILCNKNDPFPNWILMCDEKWILYNNQGQPVQCVDWEEAPKHFPKPNLHQKKCHVTVWSSAACLIHYSFLNPSETMTSEKYAQQINDMNWNLQCLPLALVNRKGPILHNNAGPHITQSTASKAEWIELWGFISSAIFTWPLADWPPLLQAS